MAKKSEVNGVGLTSVKVYKVKGADTLKANVALTFNDVIVIYVKLIEGSKGMFISFPNHSYKDGRKTKYRDDCYMLDKDFLDSITEQVIEAYEEA